MKIEFCQIELDNAEKHRYTEFVNDISNLDGDQMAYQEIPNSVANFMQEITERCGSEHADWAKNFNAAFANTLLTTVKRHEDGTTFLLTGDIPAMWLRDSTAQVRPYLVIAKEDEELAAMISGLVKKHFFISISTLMPMPLMKQQMRRASKRFDRDE